MPSTRSDLQSSLRVDDPRAWSGARGSHGRRPRRLGHRGATWLDARDRADRCPQHAPICNLVSASMIRELGPVLAGLMVAGRVGSGIAAQLGSMRVTEQIDALNTLGTDPIKKLVTPRLLAALVMLPVLTI